MSSSQRLLLSRQVNERILIEAMSGIFTCLLLCVILCSLVQIKGEGRYLDSHAHATAENYKDYDMLQSGSSMEASLSCL